MKWIFLLTIIFLASCENRKETIANRQQAIKKEMDEVKAAYFKNSDSLGRLKDADTDPVKRHAIAVALVSADTKKSMTLIKLQKEYDSLEMELKQ